MKTIARNLMLLIATCQLYSCGQHNPVASDPMAEETKALATRIALYQALHNGGLLDRLNLVPTQRLALNALTDRDTSQRNTLVETARQGLIDYSAFTRQKNDLNRTFSETFLALLTPDQIHRYETLRGQALHAYYVAKTTHPDLDIIKLIEQLDE